MYVMNLTIIQHNFLTFLHLESYFTIVIIYKKGRFELMISLLKILKNTN